MNPTHKGLWLIYANFQKDSLIDISVCGSSVSMMYPNGMYAPPPPTKTELEKIDFIQWDVETLEDRFEGLSNWYNDLYKLRAYKMEHQKKEPEEQTDYKNWVILFSVLLNIAMFVVVVRKK